MYCKVIVTLVYCYCNILQHIENLKKVKYHIFLKITLSLSIVYRKCGLDYGKIFKEEESIEILEVLGLINNTEEYQKIYNHV